MVPGSLCHHNVLLNGEEVIIEYSIHDRLINQFSLTC